MNPKADMLIPTIVTLVTCLVVAVIIFGGVVEKIQTSVKGVGEFGSCEGGIAGNSGMCMSSEMVCRKSSSSVGSMLHGCPSRRVQDVLKGSVNEDALAKYTQCCIVDKCADINDKKRGEGYSPRKSACFDGSICKTRSQTTTEDTCLGFSADCQKKDGCCCIVG